MTETRAPLFKDEYFEDIKENYMAPLFDQIFQNTRPRRLLDIGCGNGLFGSYIKKLTSCRLIGVDGSAYALEEARKAGFDEVRQLGDLCNEPLPFEPASFDFVLCKDVFEHLLLPLELLKEIRRVLSPEGMLLSHVPNHFTLPARLRFLFTNDIDTYNFFPTARTWDFPHIRFFTYAHFMEMHRQAGFRLESDLSAFFAVQIPKLWRLNSYKRVAGWLHGRYPGAFVTGFTALFR